MNKTFIRAALFLHAFYSLQTAVIAQTDPQSNPFGTPDKLPAPAKSYTSEVWECNHRGRAKIQISDYAGAIKEFDRFIELMPHRSSGYSVRAYAKSMLRDHAGALADYTRCIELDPSDAGTYYDRGEVQMCLRHWTEASSDLQRACKFPDTRNDLSHLLLWLVRSRVHETSLANQELAAFLDSHTPSQAPEEWQLHIGKFLLGRETEVELMTAAASQDTKEASGRLCQAWFYRGIKRIFSGDRIAGAEDLRKSLATKRITFPAYELAEIELKALEL